MTHRQATGFTIFIFLGLLIVVLGFFYLKNRGVSASEQSTRGEVVWQTHMSEDIDSDGKKETVYLTSYKQGDKNKSYISTSSGFLKIREKEITGFEEDLAFCPRKYFKDEIGETYLCIFGMVGAHSENIQILRWKDFSYVQFIDDKGATRDSMSCDVPNFDFDYVNLDKTKIYFDNRDYEKNPLVDIIRTHYYLDDNVFRYNGVERIGGEGLIK